MGYLLPPTPDTTEFECRKVYVPKIDSQEYLTALLGALDFFSKWVAWKEPHNPFDAKTAADVWKIANALTHAEWENGCDDMSECNVNVNVSVSNSCVYTGEGSYICYLDNGDIIINPPPVGTQPTQPVLPLPNDLTEPPEFTPGEGDPPDGWESWEAFDSDACQAANAMVEWVYRFFERAENFFGQDVFTMAAFAVVVVNVVSFGLAALFTRALQFKIVEVVGRLAFLEPLGDFFGMLAEWVDDNRQELVCELYQSRADAADWENALIARLVTASAGSLESETSDNLFLELLSYLLPAYMGLNQLYGAITFDVETPIDCSVCNCTNGYSLVDITSSVTATWDNQGHPGESGSTTSGSTITLSGVTSTNTYGGGDHIVDFTLSGITFPTPYNFKTLVIDFLSATNVDGVQFNAVDKNSPPPFTMALGVNLAETNAIIAAGLADSGLVDSSFGNSSLQIYLENFAGGVSVDAVIKVYAVTTC